MTPADRLAPLLAKCATAHESVISYTSWAKFLTDAGVRLPAPGAPEASEAAITAALAAWPLDDLGERRNRELHREEMAAVLAAAYAVDGLRAPDPRPTPAPFDGSYPAWGAEEMLLRKMLWLRHGCTHLYGDDGEMQCSECMLDFLRQSPREIEERFFKLGIEKLARVPPERPKETS